MAELVYFADMRAGIRENMHIKLERLTGQAGLPDMVREGELVAIKMHFGEKGGHAYIRQNKPAQPSSPPARFPCGYTRFENRTIGGLPRQREVNE